ncbi:50S ribosomal protein L25 [Fervidibacillus halotolerans]|uniref:Large ribosomal subunit protein bL25 n=1 Tax=Fervidibacillus halotolerans TaxID=2980027 RepID=A0A9E8RYH9_9BACI|nr:50S ribosomal protein L25 [Fervidibacillus halotolerans]WAA12856.1 50S ribosomal protein L25 [Fervidibacillus halotolerans]
MRKKMTVERRKEFTRSSLRRLRKNGRLPGVAYGKQIGNIPIHVPLKDIRRSVELGYAELIDMEIEGEGTYPVVIKEVQRDSFTGEWLHVDLFQVNMDEPITMRVPLEFEGTPQGSKSGGVLQIQEEYLEVEALPDQIPAVIKVDVSELNVGDKLTVADLKLPEGVKVIAQPNELLVTVVLPRSVIVDIGVEETEETDEEAS